MIWTGLKIYFAIGGIVTAIFLFEDRQSIREIRQIADSAGIPRWTLIIPVYLILMIVISIGWPFSLWAYAKGLIARARAQWKKWRGA